MTNTPTDTAPLALNTIVTDLTLGEGLSLSDEEQGALQSFSAAEIPAELSGEIEEEKVAVEGGAVAKELTPEESDVKKGDLRSKLGKLNLPQRLKCALFGNAFMRAILVRDGSKLVQAAVLKNPRLTPQEVEDFAKSPNTPEQVLRGIAHSSSLMRSYSMKVAIVINPKTPPDLSLKWLRFMNLNELKKISKSKSVPQVVATMAKKRVADLEAAR